MAKAIHVSLDIRGALMNYTARDYKGMFRHDDGSPMTWREAKLTLLDELAKGRRYLPFGVCEGFDYQTGCPGHELPASPDPQPATAPPDASTAPADERRFTPKTTAEGQDEPTL